MSGRKASSGNILGEEFVVVLAEITVLDYMRDQKFVPHQKHIIWNGRYSRCQQARGLRVWGMSLEVALAAMSVLVICVSKSPFFKKKKSTFLNDATEMGWQMEHMSESVVGLKASLGGIF